MTTRPEGSGTASETRHAQPEDIEPVASMLAQTFADDPLMRWYTPRSDRRLQTLEHFYATLLERVYLPRGETYVHGSLVGAALWSPPGRAELDLRELAAVTPAFARLGRRTLLGLEVLRRKVAMHPIAPAALLPGATRRRGRLARRGHRIRASQKGA